MQHRFSKSLLFQAFALVGLIAAANFLLNKLPDREELGARLVTLRFEPAGGWSAADVAPFRLAGAWALTSDDPRVGGVSALAIEYGRFVALTDSGVVLRFSRPSAGRDTVFATELPRGPGDSGFKEDRDSEALVLDPRGRGWWVAFETRNQLWLYDRQFRRALESVDLGQGRWPRNRGIEGLAPRGDGILLFPEAGTDFLRWAGGKTAQLPLERPRGQVSDAARLPDGRIVVIHRQFSVLGFVNAVTFLQPLPNGGFATGRSVRLRGTQLDNVEAIAAERLPGGGIRLWLMTDDNHQRPLRTVLVALDVPKEFDGQAAACSPNSPWQDCPRQS